MSNNKLINQESEIDDENISISGVALDFTGLQMSVIKELRGYLNSNSKLIKYSREDIYRFLENPQTYEKQIRQVSLYLASTSSYYMRLIFYMARMLTLDYLVIPDENLSPRDYLSKSFENSYKKVSEYMDTFNVKHELGKILTILMIEDVFFGYERRVKKSSMIQRLPSDYCTITGMEDGLFTFSFDMSYFDANPLALLNYDSEFKKLYENYKNTGISMQPMNMSKAMCFKYREDLTYGLPPFSAVFEDILDYNDLKELEKSKNKLENFKLLLQKIPFKKDPKSERDFLIGLDSVKMFHNNIKSVLPDQIGLISSPMDIEDFSFERTNNSLKNSLVEGKDEIFDGSGVPSEAFNPNKSSVALVKAIQTDEAMMFALLRQFERFFNRRMKEISRTYGYTVMFPDLTVYNRGEMLDSYLKTAQYGFPKSLVACALGISTSKLVGLSLLENVYLKLDEHLVPLNSSHTKSLKDDNSNGGRNKKDDGELSDKGQETRDNDSNLKRDISNS